MYFVSVDGSALSCYQVVVKIFLKSKDYYTMLQAMV